MKKKYFQPTMKVVELKHQCPLLVGSKGAAVGLSQSTRDEGFTWDDDGVEGDDY